MSKNAPPTNKNKKTWTANLMRFQYGKTSRRHTTVENLSQMSKIPKVERKIENVIKQYERNSRRPENYDFTELFDETDEKGE